MQFIYKRMDPIQDRLLHIPLNNYPVIPPLTFT